MIEFLGSCKIQQNCTAGIKVTKRDDGKILAEICHTHHGHKKEVQHTWLSKGRRKEIAACLQQGVSRDRILNDIREDATKHSDLEFKRHHLVDKKDIGNIKTSFALNDIQKHSDDQTSLRAWVQEWDKSKQNPILFAKFQGDAAPDDVNITKDDFLLVIQNPLQKYMAEKFSKREFALMLLMVQLGMISFLHHWLFWMNLGLVSQLHGVYPTMKISLTCAYFLKK